MPRRPDPSPLTVAEFSAPAGSRAVAACRRFLDEPSRHEALEHPGRLLGEYFRERGRSRTGRYVDLGNRLGEYCETVVMIGSRRMRHMVETMIAATAHPYYNLLSPAERGGRPRLICVESSLDGDLVQATLDLVRRTSDAHDLHDRWALVVEAGAANDDVATAERLAAAAPFITALRRAAPTDDDLRRRLFLLTDDAAPAALPPEIATLPHALLPRAATDTLCDGAGLLASAIVGADVVARLKGTIWFWEHAKREPEARLAPLVELLAADDLRIVAWHHALRPLAAALGPASQGTGDDERRESARHLGPRLHLFCDAVRHDRPNAAEDGPLVMPADAGTYGTFVPVPQAVRRAFDEMRHTERARGTRSAVVRLRRLNDTALGESCGWFDAARAVLDYLRSRTE